MRSSNAKFLHCLLQRTLFQVVKHPQVVPLDFMSRSLDGLDDRFQVDTAVELVGAMNPGACLSLPS